LCTVEVRENAQQNNVGLIRTTQNSRMIQNCCADEANGRRSVVCAEH
jgi:hypothetical protein